MRMDGAARLGELVSPPNIVELELLARQRRKPVDCPRVEGLRDHMAALEQHLALVRRIRRHACSRVRAARHAHVLCEHIFQRLPVQLRHRKGVKVRRKVTHL